MISVYNFGKALGLTDEQMMSSFSLYLKPEFSSKEREVLTRTIESILDKFETTKMNTGEVPIRLTLGDRVDLLSCYRKIRLGQPESL